MIAQHTHSDPPAAVGTTQARRRSDPEVSPPVDRAPDDPPAGDPGPNRGQIALLALPVAILVMTGAVWVVTAAADMWVLFPVMVLDVIVTFVVLAGVAWMLRDDAGTR